MYSHIIGSACVSWKNAMPETVRRTQWSCVSGFAYIKVENNSRKPARKWCLQEAKYLSSQQHSLFLTEDRHARPVSHVARLWETMGGYGRQKVEHQKCTTWGRYVNMAIVLLPLFCTRCRLQACDCTRCVPVECQTLTPHGTAADVN